MTRQEQTKATLDKLERLLRGSPKTARQIADSLDCTLPWAHELLRRFKKSLKIFRVELFEQDKTGPNSTAWMIK